MSSFTFDWFTPIKPVLERFVSKDAREVLEIGSFEGRSTTWFLEWAEKCTITCVDHFRGGHDLQALDLRQLFERFAMNVAPFADRVVLHKDDCWRVLSTLPAGSFDVVFVDGSHLAADVLHDAVEAYRLAKPGGMVIFDDYGWGVEEKDRPKEAIEAFLQCFASRVRVMYKEYIVVVCKL